MKKFCRSLGLGLGLAITPVLHLMADDDRLEHLDLYDIQALRDWVNTKRQVTIKEIGGNLSLSGEVRFEFQSTNEVKNGIRQRGPSHLGFVNNKNPKGRKFSQTGATTVPSKAYDVEVNIMLDYRADNTWATIKLEFDNDAGVFNSTTNKIRIEKAFWGVRLFNTDLYTMDLEIGRRFLFTTFDSKLEFSALADGIFWKNDWSVDKYGDVYVHLLAMIVDANNAQYAFLGELGWLGIMDTGLYLKYSLADWDNKSGPQFDYIVNQWLLGYKWVPKKFGKLVMPYLGILWNPAAAETRFTNFKKANLGGYLGFSLGELRKQWDWAFDANYQIAQAQVVPGFDSNGIGLGNAAGVGLYTTRTDESGALLPSSGQACGKNNFRGFMLTLDVLLTDNLNLQQQWLQACTLDKNIGPWRRYKQYEIEFVYGF